MIRRLQQSLSQS